MMKMIDEIDKKIIQDLIRNARISCSEIARQVGLSDVAISKRIRRLEENRVILRYTTIVDPIKIGYSKVSYTGLNVRPENLIDVINSLKERDYIKYLAVTTGDHNLIAVIWARSGEELLHIHEEMKKIPGVINVYPAMITDVIKNEAYF